MQTFGRRGFVKDVHEVLWRHSKRCETSASVEVTPDMREIAFRG
jgi:hypothetical protein